jgi:uncharacterized protein (TIGR02284 family)
MPSRFNAGLRKFLCVNVLTMEDEMAEKTNDFKKVAAHLNDLIDVCKDGENGYRKAAEDVKDPDLRAMFSRFSQQRGQFAGELQSAVADLGVKPETDGTARGALHRGWIDVKSAVTGRDEKAVIDECETGDDVAKGTYERVLKEGNLAGTTRSMVMQQYEQVKAAHDNVRALQLQYDRSR